MGSGKRGGGGGGSEGGWGLTRGGWGPNSPEGQASNANHHPKNTRTKTCCETNKTVLQLTLQPRAREGQHTNKPRSWDQAEEDGGA